MSHVWSNDTDRNQDWKQHSSVIFSYVITHKS